MTERPGDDLINTLEAPGEFDVLTSLRPGEPYFLLVGRDRLAPPLVDAWADKNRARALDEYSSGLIKLEDRNRELRKSTQAEMIAASMVEYKNGWDAQQRDEPPPESYTGHIPNEETARRDKLQSQRVRTHSALNNAVAECNDLAELVEDPELKVFLERVMDAMRRASETVKIKRPGVDQ